MAGDYSVPEWLYSQEGVIQQLFSDGRTYSEVSDFLITLAGRSEGRSVRRYCAERGIVRRGSISQAELDEVVRSFVARVGHSYGRRNMHGLLASQGIHACQERVRAGVFREHMW